MAKFQLNEFAEDVQKEYQKKVEAALARAEKIIHKKIQYIINEYMIKDYYQGYEPIVYKRTGQLNKSVYPSVDIGEKNGAFGITFGIEDEDPYGPSAMDHSILHVVVKHKSKKTGKIKTYEYSYKKKNYDEQLEEVIFENFMEGIHPRVGRAKTHHIEKRVNEALDYFFIFELEDIVKKELSKIK